MGRSRPKSFNRYGYDHPPRAARDVREQGLPLKTIKVTSTKTGRKIGAYTFGDPDSIRAGRIGGRKAFSKEFKARLVTAYGSRCTLTGEPLEGRYLQIDHRIPYEVAGDEADNLTDTSAYMLLDASSQRIKSFSCENCKNWTTLQDPEICRTCYWAFPENYRHVAMEAKRQLQIVWTGTEEIANFDRLERSALEAGISIQDLVKDALKKS